MENRFRTQYDEVTPEVFNSWIEHPVGESMTEPDLSLSVKDIIRRFSSGTLTPEDITRTGQYITDDIDNPIPTYKDITDIENASKQYTNAVNAALIEQNKSQEESSGTPDSEAP